MTLPLSILALCTIGLSVLLTPAWPWLHDYLSGTRAEFAVASLIQPMLFVSLALVAIGIGVGWLIYRGVRDRDPLQAANPALFSFLENRMWIDELYAYTIIALSRALARISDWTDRHVWDGIARDVGTLSNLLGNASKRVDERGINAGVDGTTAGTRGAARSMSAAHSGQIQTYLGAVGVGMLALLLLYAWLG